MLTTLLLALGSLLPSILSKFGISASIDNLIETAFSAGVSIFSSLKTGVNFSSVLTALQTALTAVETDTTLDPAVLSDISEGIRDLQAAITAYQAAEVTDDPSTLTPLQSVE